MMPLIKKVAVDLENTGEDKARTAGIAMVMMASKA